MIKHFRSQRYCRFIAVVCAAFFIFFNGRDAGSSYLPVTGSNIGIGTSTPNGAFIVMSGNVGIGTWIPASKLQVVGTVAATAFSGDGSALTGIASAGGWNDGGTNVYTSATTDTVGIGTTNPSTTLEIVKQSANPPLMVSSVFNGDGEYLIVHSSGNVGVGTTTPVGAFTVMNGNAGIGTWSPTVKLEVNGDISIMQGALVANFINGDTVALVAGDLVIADTGIDTGVERTTTSVHEKIVGAVVVGGSVGATVKVAIGGIFTVKVTGATSRGQFLRTSTTAGSAVSAGAGTGGQGDFAIALSTTAGAGTVKAVFIKADIV